MTTDSLHLVIFCENFLLSLKKIINVREQKALSFTHIKPRSFKDVYHRYSQLYLLWACCTLTFSEVWKAINIFGAQRQTNICHVWERAPHFYFCTANILKNILYIVRLRLSGVWEWQVGAGVAPRLLPGPVPPGGQPRVLLQDVQPQNALQGCE